jgi:aminoglycoside phosphotransferase (APT) family kinase protein
VAYPDAEIEIDAALVRSLLTDQHPDLAGLALTSVGAGWDNALWRLGDELLARLPRRAVAAPLTIQEQRWLPELAAHLPLPVPAPLRTGRPSADYPWPWSIVPWLPGVPGDRATLSRPSDAAARLGRFLRALHHDAPPEAPLNPYRGVAVAARAATVEELLVRLATEIDAQATLRIWNQALAADPWAGPPVWVHGDLHPANTLVVDGTLAAVIDFGDLCAGDPATDIAGAWMLLPGSAFGTFRSAYGGIDDELQRRSLGWAALFALILLDIGMDGRPTYARVARSTLARILAPPG